MVRWHHGLSGHEFEQALGNSLGTPGKPGILQSMGLQRVGHDLVTEQQEDILENPFKALGEAHVSCELNCVCLFLRWLGSVLVTHSWMEVSPSGSL